LINEFFVLTLIAAASISIGWLLGLRSFWLALPVGLAAVMATRLLTYTFFHDTGLSILGNPVFFSLLGLSLLWAAWKAKIGEKLWVMMAPAVAIALLAVTATRVFGVQGTNHGDSIWIVTLAHLFDINGNLHILNGHTPIKRGFIYPLMLALGAPGEYLSSFTPFIFAALGAAAVWLTLELTKKIDQRRLWIVGGLLAVTSFSAIMPLRAIFYINGHTTIGLGVLLATAAVVISVRDGMLTRNNLIITCLGVFMIAAGRIEGIVLAAIVVLPLLSQRWILRREIMLIISSATVPVAIWLTTYHSYIIHGTHLNWYVFDAILILGGLLPALRIFDWFRFRSVFIGVGALLAIFITAQVVFHDSFRQGNYALISNLLQGRGGWGLLVLLVPLAVLFSQFRKSSSELRSLFTILLGLVLASMLAKMLDSGQFGEPTMGRVGWSDSLNRMWIHIFALILVVTAVSLVENDKLWAWLPNRKNTKVTK
jgi:hypothetical protein